MDYSDRKTETELIALERKLKSLYKQSWDDMRVEAESYFEDFGERYQREYKKYQAGEYTEAQFKAWYQSQVARGKTWEAKRDTLAWMMVHANEKACEYINDTTPSIFSLNANYLAYMTEQQFDVAFTLVDEGTVRNLVMEKSNNIEFRTNSINPKRDYKWNSKQIQNALVAGIMQGKSIDKIADSFMVVQQRNRNSAIRNARTSVTSAQNAGRIDTMRRSKEMGIEVQKQWLSAHDGRVRDSHANLNGQIREIDEPFDNDLMYPADADGIPAEVYNCRCTLKYIYPKYQKIKSTENYRETKQGNETYQQWLHRKEKDAINEARLIDSIEYNSKGTHIYTKETLVEELQSSVVGRHFAETIENKDIKIVIYDSKPNESARASQQEKRIEIYSENIPSSFIAGQSLVHEMAHYEFNIGQCQHAEAICFAYEKMHKENRDYLTQSEWDRMVQLAKTAYPEFEWEKGGYGDYEQFNFVRVQP